MAVGWRAVLVLPKGQCSHPWRSYRRGVHLQDAADHDAIGKHIIVVIVPVAGWAARRRALEDERSHVIAAATSSLAS